MPNTHLARPQVAFLRPAPDAPRRPLWNAVHHNLGRLAVLAAWANCSLGIYLAHSRFMQVSAGWWCDLWCDLCHKDPVVRNPMQ